MPEQIEDTLVRFSQSIHFVFQKTVEYSIRQKHVMAVPEVPLFLFLHDAHANVHELSFTVLPVGLIFDNPLKLLLLLIYDPLVLACTHFVLG